jgi:peptidyl-prolyl cis-trans isomerase B (cyclophilin B)
MNQTVRLHTNHGAIDIALDAERAPRTVENFVQYVRDGFFDGTIFHRVIPGFMIQGGGFGADGAQKGTRAPIDNEADNGLKNARYTVAMARTSAPHSASAQFFINIADNAFLNHTAPTAQGWGYAVFGQVSAGQDVVDRIAGVKTGRRGPHADWPTEDVVIERAELLAA